MVKGERGHRRTQSERSTATRAALVAAGRRLFSTKGYAATGREEIVAAAGVTRGALQHHFGDKEHLFLAVYETVEAEVVDAIAVAAMSAGDDAVDQLRAGCGAYLDAVLDPAIQRICAVDGPAVLRAEVRQEIVDRYALGMVREGLATAMAAGRIEEAPVEPLARMLLAAVTAAAEYVATADDPQRARVDSGATITLLIDRLERPRARGGGRRRAAPKRPR